MKSKKTKSNATKGDVTRNDTSSDMFAAFDETLATIKDAKKIVLIHDADADGISSAIIAHHALHIINPKATITLHTSVKREFFAPSFIEQALADGTDCFIALDNDPVTARNTQALGLIQAAAHEPHLIIIDHHPPKTEEAAAIKRVALINPFAFGDEEGSRYCTAKLAFDLFGRHANISQFDWLAALGIIGDHCMERWADFLTETATKYDAKTPIEKPEDWFRSPLATLLSLIDCARAIDLDAIIEIRNILLGTRTFEEGLKTESPHAQVKEEVTYYCRTYKQAAEIDEKHKLLMLEVKSKYHINSWLASIISNDLPSYVYLLYSKSEDAPHIINISARCQSQRIHCGQLLEEATEHIDGARGGGHAPAAGAKCPADMFTTFKRHIYAFLEREDG
jgi:hypothetical protein